jgi:hypothetical protein
MEKYAPSYPVRVRVEVENLVEAVAEKIGLENSTVRNLAILLGLQDICTAYITHNKPYVVLDTQFQELLQYTRKIVELFSEIANERQQAKKVAVYG